MSEKVKMTEKIDQALQNHGANYDCRCLKPTAAEGRCSGCHTLHEEKEKLQDRNDKSERSKIGLNHKIDLFLQTH